MIPPLVPIHIGNIPFPSSWFHTLKMQPVHNKVFKDPLLKWYVFLSIGMMMANTDLPALDNPLTLPLEGYTAHRIMQDCAFGLPHQSVVIDQTLVHYVGRSSSRFPRLRLDTDDVIEPTDVKTKTYATNASLNHVVFVFQTTDHIIGIKLTGDTSQQVECAYQGVNPYPYTLYLPILEQDRI